MLHKQKRHCGHGMGSIVKLFSSQLGTRFFSCRVVANRAFKKDHKDTWYFFTLARYRTTVFVQSLILPACLPSSLSRFSLLHYFASFFAL